MNSRPSDPIEINHLTDTLTFVNKALVDKDKNSLDILEQVLVKCIRNSGAYNIEDMKSAALLVINTYYIVLEHIAITSDKRGVQVDKQVEE